MAVEEKYRVNYYVGAMLAQGGEVRLEEAKVVFSPTSALDRAMGATDVEIPFQDIRGLEHKGSLLRTFCIKTDEKTHKFEGSQAKKLAETLENTLLTKGLMKAIQVEQKSDAVLPQPGAGSYSVSTCTQCVRTLKSDFLFCPYCGFKLDRGANN